MPNFNYSAVGANGKAVRGSVTADRIEIATRQLRAQGMTLLEIKPGALPVGGSAGLRLGGAKVGRGDVLAMTRDLSVLLRAGLPIDRALKVMIDMAGSAAVRSLLDELLTSVKGGKGLSQALQAHQEIFGTFYISMVRSGEASGHLAQVLARLLDYLENSRAVRSSVISALIYPVILLTVAVVSISVILGFVVPQFEALFADLGDALPVLTRGVIALGDFIAGYWWLLLLVAAIAFMLVRNWVRSDEGRARLDQWLLQLPLAGEVLFKYEIAKFARTLGTLLGNGVSLLKAIAIGLDTVGNSQVKEALSVLEPAAKRGQRMSQAMDDTGKFTPMVVQMMRVGEESGALDDMMDELARVYDDEVQAGVKRGLALLEPLLILVMGGSIALIIIAILMGILSVNDLAF
jgi:general secretion pathway protein F